jgi:hypothetical protein
MPNKPIIIRDVEWILATTRQMAENEKRIAESEAAATYGALNLSPGERTPDGTVYVGQYSPKDREGNSLSKTFNVFAAPKDLPGTMTYLGAVKHIAGVKNWHGHEGTHYATDKEFYAAVKDGSYNGGWIVPTHDILIGNLYPHKNTGALKGTFCEAARSGSGCPDWYWSSTGHRENWPFVHGARFSDGFELWHPKDDFSRFSCRPVRLVPV